MSEQPKLDYGETVRVTGKTNKGRIGLVVGIHGEELSKSYSVKFEDGSEFEISDEFLSKCKSTAKLNVKTGLLFAALGFAIVVALGVLSLSFNINPPDALWWLAPPMILFATEDLQWGFIFIIAPLNAALYGGTAFAVTSTLRYLIERHRIVSSAR